MAKLKEEANRNVLCRNVFAHCGSTFLRDGGVQQTAVNVVTDRQLKADQFAHGDAIREVVGVLLEPIPLDDIGPYDHPWRAAGSGS